MKEVLFNLIVNYIAVFMCLLAALILSDTDYFSSMSLVATIPAIIMTKQQQIEKKIENITNQKQAT